MAAYALTVLLFMPFLLFFSLSFSRNLRCSSALRRPSLASRCSFFSLSAASLRSSAFSSSSRRRILAICSSRVCRMRRSASGRKCAFDASASGRRRKAVKTGMVEAESEVSLSERLMRLRGLVSSRLEKSQYGCCRRVSSETHVLGWSMG